MSILSKETMAELANEYAGLPNTNMSKGFSDLLAHANKYEPPVEVKLTSEMPYTRFEALASDFHENNKVEVQVFHDDEWDHPYWSPLDMAKYMTWHDIDGHVRNGLDFSQHGEAGVFASHVNELFSPEARAAMFTEIVYRIAWIHTYGWTFQYKPVELGPVGQAVMEALS